MNLSANPERDEPNEAEANFKLNFEQTLLEYDQQHLDLQGSHRKPWSRKRVCEVINLLKNAKLPDLPRVKTSMEYYWMSKYDVITNNDEVELIFKKKKSEDPTIRIIPREEYFEYIDGIHKSCGHGGRDKMLLEIKNRFYIPKKAIEIYSSLCYLCNTKRSSIKKTTTTRKQEFNIRGHVHLIDFQSCLDGDYNWLLYYQDTGTKFISLRPLKSDNIAEVGVELTKIFLIFGAPYTLQSDRDRRFTDELVDNLMAKWPGYKITSEDPQRHGNTEPNNIKHMVNLWMKENKSSNWSFGCSFVQYKINTSFKGGVNRSPYKSVFNLDPNLLCVICQHTTSSSSTVCALCKNCIHESCSIQDEVESRTICLMCKSPEVLKEEASSSKRKVKNGDVSNLSQDAMNGSYKKVKMEIEVDLDSDVDIKEEVIDD